MKEVYRLILVEKKKDNPSVYVLCYDPKLNLVLVKPTIRDGKIIMNNSTGYNKHKIVWRSFKDHTVYAKYFRKEMHMYTLQRHFPFTCSVKEQKGGGVYESKQILAG